jgi:hypothetical protein
MRSSVITFMLAGLLLPPMSAQEAGKGADVVVVEMPSTEADGSAPEVAKSTDSSSADDPKNVYLEGFGSAIPTPYPADRYAATWEKNPFMVVVVSNPGPSVSFAQDWALTGLTVRPSGEAAAYIRNKQTQEFKRITNSEDKDGFKLLEANPNPDRKQASVKVAKGAETATLTYDESMTAPAPAAPRAPMPGQQQPGVPPGQPSSVAGRPVIPVPGGVQPQQMVPQPGIPAANATQPPNQPPGAAPRSPSGRRRILIPPPIPPQGTPPATLQ